jgi:hypothetical protein
MLNNAKETYNYLFCKHYEFSYTYILLNIICEIVIPIFLVLWDIQEFDENIVRVTCK